MHPGDCLQVGAAGERVQVLAHQFALATKLIEQLTAIEHAEGFFSFERRFHHLLILFLLHGTGRIDKSASGRNLGQDRAQYLELPAVEIEQILALQAPLDFGIASQGTGAGAGHVGQHPVKTPLNRQSTSIGHDHVQVGCGNEFAQQTSAMGMELGSQYPAARIAVREQPCLSTRCRATVKNLAAFTHQKGNQLGSFILNHDRRGLCPAQFCEIPCDDSPGIGQEESGPDLNAPVLECVR